MPVPVEFNTADFFDKAIGLDVQALGEKVLNIGQLGVGPDGGFWAYDYGRGVWVPDDDEPGRRIVGLLGARYRVSHEKNTLGRLRRDPTVPAITCDPVPDYINFRNGMLDWRTGELLKHAPEFLSTVQLPVNWEPDAQCPEFADLAARIVPEDAIPTLWEMVGYLLYNGNPFQRAFLLYGPGSNGKSTFLGVMEALLGAGNVSHLTLDHVNKGRFERAELFGKLANFAGDIDATYQQSTAGIKTVTGGEAIRAERKYKDAFVFTPWASFVFSANKIPGSADVSHGYLRRWVILPMPNVFTGHDDLLPGLTTPGELSGIAARAVPVLRDLIARHEFTQAPSIVAAKDEFARTIDQVREWVHDGAYKDQSAWIPRATLYQSYKTWTFQTDHKPVKAAEFYNRLRAAGFAEAIRQGQRGFKGVRPIAPEPGHSFARTWST